MGPGQMLVYHLNLSLSFVLISLGNYSWLRKDLHDVS